MAVKIWPTTLPQAPQKGYTETVGVNIIRSQPDAGPAKQRRRASRPNTMSISFIMTTEQTAILENFVKDDLSGVSRFRFPHPRLSTTIDARITPQQDGQFFQIQYLAPGYWTISLNIEILP